jgi:hypothetical protein
MIIKNLILRPCRDDPWWASKFTFATKLLRKRVKNGKQSKRPQIINEGK